MSVEKVSYSSFPHKFYFTDKTKSQQSPQTSQIAQNTDKTQNNRNLKTIGGIAAGLAIIAAAGIAIASRGRIKSKNLSLDAFQKAGNKFVKGKAITKTGEGFTGVLEQSSKNGRTYVKRYENGLLSEVKILEGEKEVSSRVFEYNTEGVVNKVTDGQGNSLYEMRVENGIKIIKTPRVENRYNAQTGKIILKYTFDEKGHVISDKTKRFAYTKDGKKYLEQDYSRNLTYYHSDGKTPEIIMDGEGNTIFYDKNGKVLREMRLYRSGYLDKPTGLYCSSRSHTAFGVTIDTTEIDDGVNKIQRYVRYGDKVDKWFDVLLDIDKHERYCETPSVYLERGKDAIVYMDGRHALSREGNEQQYDEWVNKAKEAVKSLLKKYKESYSYKERAIPLFFSENTRFRG